MVYDNIHKVHHPYTYTPNIETDESRFKVIYDTMQAGVARVSLDFRIVHANRMYCNILGYTEDEIAGRSLMDFIHPDISDDYLKMYCDLAAGHIDHFHMEKKIIHKTGEPVYGMLDANLIRDTGGKPSFIIATAVDITEQKKSEQKLRENEDLFRSLMESCGNGLIMQEDSGRIILCNTAAEELLGLRKENIQGKYPAEIDWHIRDTNGDILPPEEFPSSYTLRTGKPVNRYLIRIESGDDVERWATINTRPVFRSSGTVPDLVVTGITDITELKCVQNDLALSLEKRNALFRELQHRVKNTFTCIQTLAGMELKNTDDPEARDLVLKLIQRIRTFSELYGLLDNSGSGFHRIRMDLYLEEIIHSIRDAALNGEQNILITTNLQEVYLDIKQASPWGLILNELITNARKYAFRGIEAGSISVTFAERANSLSLEVEDNGIGLPEGFSLEADSGLGLTLVRILSEQLGAGISLSGRNGTRCVVKTRGQDRP